ncbi:uncharacterized protein LOC131878243 isoform X1 [Tigriopus californicus]|uniref:uncharacterized protein LOC131878243 isoform X1 n=1 Tax=Tigriopus californicus TaxID=6832 RepID=UPI0027DA7F69|nr:uncharacterized protein LOC131878243 isoform X1 [Tigriopus californicus]XP_059080147.1 uncharacterized protein LOC131878243 isoform X1 [Tigriopus californicus]XP_059080148.1 uncharacterized protein LOC131878243 isoform X1 [Tigriopus californicus]
MESPTLPQLSSALAQALQHSNHLNGEITTTDVYEPEFGQHVSRLRGTMFYVCQGSCLCGTVNNRGKVIYCYGDLVPRQGELFAEGTESNGSTTSKDLLAALLGAWIVGILALLIVLLLIRKSIVSVKHHLEKVSDRLPVYHDDDLLSQNSTTSPGPGHVKDTTLDSVVGLDDGDGGRHTPSDALGFQSGSFNGGGGGGGGGGVGSEDHHDLFSEDGTLTPDGFTDESPIHIGVQRLANQSKGVPVENLKKMRLHRKDFKKGGEALRGKNVVENFRVKEKDMKRTMK